MILIYKKSSYVLKTMDTVNHESLLKSTTYHHWFNDSDEFTIMLACVRTVQPVQSTFNFISLYFAHELLSNHAHSTDNHA